MTFRRAFLALLLAVVCAGCLPQSYVPAESSGPRIALAGDSISQDASPVLRPALAEIGPTSYTAVPGTRIWEHFDTIARVSPAPDVVILELGVNDAAMHGWTGGDQARMGYLIDLAPEAACIIVVPPVVRPGVGSASAASRFATGWRAEVERWPNATVTGWDATLRAHPGWWRADGIHLTASGSDAFSAMVLDAVEACP